MKTYKEIDGKTYTYRIALKEDIIQVMEVIEDGREELKKQGNGQWQFGYPNRDNLLSDIENGNLYVIDNGERIVGVLAIVEGDPEYPFLESGSWLSDYPFLVMHRCAVKKEYHHKGLGMFLFEIFEEVGKEKNFHSLRLDTHEKNPIMNHLLIASGFTDCGTIILKPDKHRHVFEKLI